MTDKDREGFEAWCLRSGFSLDGHTLAAGRWIGWRAGVNYARAESAKEIEGLRAWKEGAQNTVRGMGKEIERLQRVVEVWRKCAYENGGVTEADVEAYIAATQNTAPFNGGITQNDELSNSSRLNSTCGESLGNSSQRGGDV